ncbi:MAG: FHA domain-containing protein [Myxococcota bacterium]|nr:FHA domain-containing protein [Myxococcota bacterium]
MAPSNPKRPGRPPASRPADPQKKTELELPFDDGIEPLRADDPAPQRVPQFPAHGKRAPKQGRYHTPIEPADQELPPSYATGDVAEPGYSPASVYVERGPGMGQLAPVKQGLVLIGRASLATLRLQHPSISRRHSQITRRGERFFIKDLGSQNGTYVNQQRIEREVEIFAGDELVIGTSQLRLRGPGVGNTGTSTRSRQGPGPQGAFFNSHVTGIAIASCAVGIGLASVIIFAFFKFSGGPSDEQAPVAMRAASPLPADLPLPVPSSVPASVHSATDKVDEAPAPEVAEVAPGPAPAPVPTRTAEPRPLAKRTAPVRKAQPAPEPVIETEVRIDPVILARYERGDVAAAIELARKKDQEAVVTKLARFQGTWESAQKALAAGDEQAALRHLDLALKQDEAIGGGWSSYNAQIRRQLSAVHLMAGTRLAKAGDSAAAQTALKQALRFDPQNQAAKAELTRLQAAASKPKSQAIDAAFGD